MFKCDFYFVLINVLNVYSLPWNFKDVNYDDLSPEFLKEGGGSSYTVENQAKKAKYGNQGYLDFLGFGSGGKRRYANDAHEGNYEDQGGIKKIKFDKDGHYLIYNRGGKGVKGLVYEESGSYSKGHKTVGSHLIHNLDEYKKDTDFYDENHAEGRKMRYGGYHKEVNGKSGDLKNRGHKNIGYRVSTYGKNGRFAEGSDFFDDAGYKQQLGKKKYFLNEGISEAKNGDAEFENWKL